MNSKATLAILLLVSVCLVGYTNAWGFTRRGGSSGRGKGNWSSNSTLYNRTANFSIAVRRVDEDHPYFRTFSINRNLTLSSLKQGLARFLNQTASITLLVKNDRLLLTTDADVRTLSYKDQVEVSFANSGAPTRYRTMYAYSKVARKPSWSGKSDKDKGKDKKKDKRGGRRGEESEEEEDSLFAGFD